MYQNLLTIISKKNEQQKQKHLIQRADAPPCVYNNYNYNYVCGIYLNFLNSFLQKLTFSPPPPKKNHV